MDSSLRQSHASWERSEEEDVCHGAREACMGGFGMHYKQETKQEMVSKPGDKGSSSFLCLDAALTTLLFYLRVVSNSL